MYGNVFFAKILHEKEEASGTSGSGSSSSTGNGAGDGAAPALSEASGADQKDGAPVESNANVSADGEPVTVAQGTTEEKTDKSAVKPGTQHHHGCNG